MARVAAFRSTSRRRTIVYSVGAALLVLVLIAGLAFAYSVSVTRVANNASSLHWSNATIGTSALTRAGLVQAITFGELQGNEFVDSADFEFALEQLSASVADLEHLFEIGETRESYPALARFVAPVTLAVADLRIGDFATAKQRVTTDVEQAYVELVDSLDLEQESVQAAIADSREDGDALNGWVVFVLTLAVPGSAVVAYFIVARGQVRALKEQNRLELEAERTISRAKDSFIAGLSHELRTPLTSIYGFAEILSDGGVQGREATEETAKIIANEAAEMARMVDDLLAASRLESTGIEIEMAPTRIQEVVESAMTPFERAGMTINSEPTSVIATTDAARLRQVLINLLSNAARHGGPVRGIEVTEGDGIVDIEVWDNGAGVPNGRVDKVFDPFVHNGEAPLLTGSIGLGLAVASRLTGLMNGKLQYQRSGGRTYFIVSLPVAAVAEVEESPDSTSVASMIRALSA